MSTSRMMADKMNIDLRHSILFVLEGLYFFKGKKEDKGYIRLNKAKRMLGKLKTNYFMLDSLHNFHRIDLDIPAKISRNIDKIEKVESKKIEKKGKIEEDLEKIEKDLIKMLMLLKEKFNENIGAGILEKRVY